MPEQDRLYRDPALAELYDLDNAGFRPDFPFCIDLARDARSVLDLGCGTGELAAILAEGRDVVGADPAAAMLDVARRRPGGGKVEWVEADARDMRLGRTFDLVLLTGHAFQTLLTRADRLAALKTIAAHLSSGGPFIFDSRTPAAVEWREWTPVDTQRTLQHPQFGCVESWNDVRQDAETGIVTYETHYRFADGRHVFAESEIAFPEKEEIAETICEAGLAVDTWHGEWDGRPWVATEPEIIPLGRLART